MICKARPRNCGFDFVNFFSFYEFVLFKPRQCFLIAIVMILLPQYRGPFADSVLFGCFDGFENLRALVDPKWRAYVRDEMGVDPDRALAEAIEADNACLAGAKRDGVTFAIHLCRGNYRSQWYAEGGYDAIADRLSTTTPAVPSGLNARDKSSDRASTCSVGSPGVAGWIHS